VNVLTDPIGQMSDRGGRCGPQKMAAPWRAPQRGLPAPLRYGARHRPKQVRARGAPKGPQTPVNVLTDPIGQMADGGGRCGPQKMTAPWRAPQRGLPAPLRYGARHRPKQVRAGGAPKGPQSPVNVLCDFIGQEAVGSGRCRPQKNGGAMAGPPSSPASPPEIWSPPPAKTGACWGCPKGATNVCVLFRAFDWSGVALPIVSRW